MNHIKHTIAVLTAFCIMLCYIPAASIAAEGETESSLVSEEQTTDQNENTQVNGSGTDSDTEKEDTVINGTDGNETGDGAVDPEGSEQNGGADQTVEGEKSPVPEEQTNAAGPAKTTLKSVKSGDTVNYTSKKEKSGKYDKEINVFNVTKDGRKYQGTCAQIGTQALKSGSAKATRVSNSSRHAKLIYKYAILEDWWTGPAGEKSAKTELGMSGTVKTTNRLLLEHMNQICIQGSSWKKEAVNNAGMTSSFANKVYKYVTGRDVSGISVPDTFELYYCEVGSGQDFTIWAYSTGEISSTSASDKESHSQNMMACANRVIVDKVNYKNVAPDEKYTLKATVYDKTAGKMLGASATKDFVPKSSSGSIEIEIKTNATGLENHTLVVYETLSVNGKVVSTHNNANDKAQTVYIPEISTSASDTDTADKITNCSDEIEIKDLVRYNNLIPGKKYRMTGTLMDKETGEAIEIDGTPVTAETEFEPVDASGYVEVIFSFNGKGLEGKTVVAFEECRIGDAIIAVHMDIDDEEQSVRIPELYTEAGIEDDGTVIDIVSYSNLIPGKTYTVKGYLNDKESGGLIEGSEGEATFTPDSDSGTVEVRLYPGDAYGQLVAFESLYLIPDQEDEEASKGVLIAEHNDIDNEAQTVEIEAPPEETPPEETPPVEKKETPDTGDRSLLHGWMAFMAISSAVLLIMIAKRLRDRA